MIKVLAISWGVMVGGLASMIIGRGFALAIAQLDTILGVFH